MIIKKTVNSQQQTAKISGRPKSRMPVKVPQTRKGAEDTPKIMTLLLLLQIFLTILATEFKILGEELAG